MSAEYHESWFRDRLDEARYLVDPQDGRSYEDIYYQSGLAPEVPGQQELPIDLESLRAKIETQALTKQQQWERYYDKP